jgi:hypothetical protein
MRIRTHVGLASVPLSTDYVDIAMIKNTVSLSWRIGRAIALARKQSSLSRIGSILVDAVGGSKSAKVLFMGKITDVKRRSVLFHSLSAVVEFILISLQYLQGSYGWRNRYHRADLGRRCR